METPNIELLNEAASVDPRLAASTSSIKPGMVPLRERTCTIQFALFVRILLNNSRKINLLDEDFLLLDFIEVSTEIAQLVEQHDPEEAVCHVQWIDVNTNKDLELPQVWNKQAWLVSYQRWVKTKEASEASRAIAIKRDSILHELKSAIMRDTGLDADDAVVLASSMMQKRQVNKCKMYGVDITTLPQISHTYVTIPAAPKE